MSTTSDDEARFQARQILAQAADDPGLDFLQLMDLDTLAEWVDPSVPWPVNYRRLLLKIDRADSAVQNADDLRDMIEGFKADE